MSTSDLERCRERLETRSLGRPLVVLAETVSTMDEARASLARGDAAGVVVVADRQTGGRGTHGRTWSSPPGEDLYVSFTARPDVPIERLPTMALAVGLGIARGIGAFVDPARVSLKWPNDVLVDGGKCVGILVETRATADGIDGVVVGFGVNVNRTEFDVDAVPRPTSIALACGARADRADVLATVLREVERALDTWSTEPLDATLVPIDAMLAYRGELVRIDASAEVGTLVGLDASGGLRIAYASGERTHQAGRLERISSGAASA